MWKRGGRSSALDRAEALLSSKKASGGGAESPPRSAAETPVFAHSAGKYVESAPPNTHTLLSDLSDLSPLSSALQHGVDVMGSADAKNQLRGQRGYTKDLSSLSSLGRGGRRFLKKAPPPITSSSQSPARKVQVPKHRFISSTHYGSQTSALSRLAQIESPFSSQKQSQAHDTEEEKTAHSLTPDMRISHPTVVSQSLESHSRSGEGQKGKHVHKNKETVAVTCSKTEAAAYGSPKSLDGGVRFSCIVIDASVSQVDLETKSMTIVSGVGLTSDEEDMRKLLGDRLESTDNSVLRQGSSRRTADKVQAHFSPSVLSSSFPQSVSPSSHTTERGQCSLSSMLGHEAPSLEVLFPVGPGSNDPHSETSLASSKDFKINVMTLDDLIPVPLGFIEETPAKEDEVDYLSDFESESRTEPHYSTNQISEHLLGDREQEEVVSEIGEEALDSDMFRRRTEDSNTFSDRSSFCTSQTSDSSQESFRRSRDFRPSTSHQDWESSRLSRRCASPRKVLKEAAVQTQPNSLAYTSGIAAVGMNYMNPTLLTTHTVSTKSVHACSTFSPTVYLLSEMLKQHLAMTRQFIESSRHLHSNHLKSLEPPSYRYITLKDTRKYIWQHTTPKLMREEVLNEVQKEKKRLPLDPSV